MIAAEEHEDQTRITFVMREGTRTGVDAMEKGKGIKQWIRKKFKPMPTFNPHKEKETYQQDRKEILGSIE
jgi:hypothetical protein